MARFDLSDAADFSRLTQGSIRNVGALLTGRDPNEWDLLEASYRGIKFHIFESARGFQDKTYQGALSRVVDGGGRRKVKYQFPYRDGQTTDDLGRRPGSFEMDIVIHGNKYMDGYRKLIEAFDDPTPGVLVHPIRGEITCVVEDATWTHQNDQRKAVALRATFIEHNFTIGNVRELEDSLFKKALSNALKVFAIVDTAINKIEAAILLQRAAKNLIKSYLAVYKRNNAKTLTKMNRAFNTGGTSADIPSLLPVNVGGTGKSTTATTDDGITETTTTINSSIASDSTFVVASSPSDPFNSIPVAELSDSTILAIAVSEIEKEVSALRDELTVVLESIRDSGASLELFDTQLALRETAVLLQDALEKGIASSNAAIIEYTTPRLMSLREVAFANGINISRVRELDLLNPSLLSVNFIEKGTALRVPSK